MLTDNKTMTVGALRDLLEKYEQDLLVVVADIDFGVAGIHNICPYKLIKVDIDNDYLLFNGTLDEAITVYSNRNIYKCTEIQVIVINGTAQST